MELAAFGVKPSPATSGLMGPAWTDNDGYRRRLEVGVGLILHGLRKTLNEGSDVEGIEIEK